jgi:hypothetical protein
LRLQCERADIGAERLPPAKTRADTRNGSRHLQSASNPRVSAKNEAAAQAMGVKRVCIPNRSTKSPERKREQKNRWFRNGQKWRTGCEGRISVVKRRFGTGAVVRRLVAFEHALFIRRNRRPA